MFVLIMISSLNEDLWSVSGTVAKTCTFLPLGLRFGAIVKGLSPLKS